MKLDLVWESSGIPIFLTLLQAGVAVRADFPANLRELLCRQLGISDDYLDNRINTIFLDGRPVDDVDTAFTQHGSVLALSASMPGFAGAALRKGGFYSGMRSTITYSAGRESSASGEGFFLLRLYNITVKELGPHFLSHGVGIDTDALSGFFSERPAVFWQGFRKATLNDKEVPVNELQNAEWNEKSEFVQLRVEQVD
jgi:hypothetical protein